MKSWIGLCRTPSVLSGAGLLALNILRALHRRGSPKPLLLDGVQTAGMDPETLAMVQGYQSFVEAQGLTNVDPNGTYTLNDCIMLHGVGDNFDVTGSSARFTGENNVGLIAFDQPRFSEDAIRRAETLDGVITQSHWNKKVLEAHGLTRVRSFSLGIDTAHFFPRPKTGRYQGRFAVFSGGKLEFRKGQDIVLMAFKAFKERHSDALLVTAWHSPWPATSATMAGSPHATAPKVIDNQLHVVEWASAHGIQADDIVDLGLVANHQLPIVIGECDLGIFASRCEGGTDIIAMETMACGVPTVLSNNTGHADLIEAFDCYPLQQQGPVSHPTLATDDWGESSVEELVEIMEHAYANREDNQRIGDQAAGKLQAHSWDRQIEEFLAAVDALIDA